MHGNVWEWVQDGGHSNYNGAPADGSAWKSGDGPSRVARGGCCGIDCVAGDCRSAFRGRGGSRYRDGDLGFRLLKEQ
jgi:formylglycine-generating enzyme required for sulfatase activity